MPLCVVDQHAAEHEQHVELQHEDANGSEHAETAYDVQTAELAGPEPDHVGQTADCDADPVVGQGVVHDHPVRLVLLGASVLPAHDHLDVVEPDTQDKEWQQVVHACLFEAEHR